MVVKKALRSFDDIADAYRAACEKAFAWHSSVVSPGILCKAGCDACCHGLFDVTILDILTLRQGYSALPQQIRVDVRARAESIKHEMSAQFSAASFAQIEEKDEDRFYEHFKSVPCPFLFRGQCVVYESRTYICRMTGIPFFDGESWDDSPICDMNFRSNDFRTETDAQKKYAYNETKYFSTEESLLEQVKRLSQGDAKESVYAYFVIPDFIDFCAKEDEADE